MSDEKKESKESGTHDSAAPSRRPSNAHPTRNTFFMGAASGLIVAFLAPAFSKQVRPFARGLVKSGIRIAHRIQRAASGLKEEFEDIAAEAKAEIDQEQGPEPGQGQ